MALDQEGFRWRNDDGDEDAATWAASQDSNVSVALDTNIRLRIVVDVSDSNGPASADFYRLEARNQAGGDWFEVVPPESTDAGPIVLSLSPHVSSSGEVTTPQLTPPANKVESDFADGRMWDDQSGIDEITLFTDQYTELEFSIRAEPSNGALAGEVYEFRVTRKEGQPAAGGGDDGDNLLTSLISFWELEEASGTRADAHGANDLTDNNTVTQTTGIVGNCGQFTLANTEFLSHADDATLQTGNIDQTFCAWVYLDSKPATSMSIIDKGELLNDYFLRWVTTTDRFRFVLFDVGGAVAMTVTANTFGAPAEDTWHFVVARFDAAANTGYISVNAGTEDSAAQAADPVTSTNDFGIGGRVVDSSLLWDGRIDQVGLWKRTLTAAEITWLYNSGNGRAFSELGP